MINDRLSKEPSLELNKVTCTRHLKFPASLSSALTPDGSKRASPSVSDVSGSRQTRTSDWLTMAESPSWPL